MDFPLTDKFFHNIHEQLIKNGLGFVALARSASRPVAATVFLRLGEKALYKYAASDERYQDLRGNDLVMWEGINFLVQRVRARCTLAERHSRTTALRRFKALGMRPRRRSITFDLMLAGIRGLICMVSHGLRINTSLADSL